MKIPWSWLSIYTVHLYKNEKSMSRLLCSALWGCSLCDLRNTSTLEFRILRKSFSSTSQGPTVSVTSSRWDIRQSQPWVIPLFQLTSSMWARVCPYLLCRSTRICKIIKNVVFAALTLTYIFFVYQNSTTVQCVTFSKSEFLLSVIKITVIDLLFES